MVGKLFFMYLVRIIKHFFLLPNFTGDKKQKQLIAKKYVYSLFLGTLGLIWYLVWIIVIRDTPSKDSRIDQKELVYITEAIKAIKNNTKIKVPWTKIISSRAVIANTICLTCESWGFNTMLTFLPQIMKCKLFFNF